MKQENSETKTIAECACSIEKCDILDFMAKHVGVSVLHPGGLNATKKLLSMMDVNKQTSILDVACGKGTSSYYFVKEYNCNVTGIDIDENLLRYAKELSIKKNVKDKMMFQVGNAEKLPFADNTFDVVIFQAALVLIRDMEKAISEAARVTKKDGKIGILELTWLKEPTENMIETAIKDICGYCMTRAKDIDGWKNLLKNAGLKIKESQTFPMDSQKVGDEGIGTMLKVMFRMIMNPVIRKRINKVNHFFKDTKDYLGYALLVGEK
jgi:ubiquinone/menaquinone biosynthesis C-methylase UbiE